MGAFFLKHMLFIDLNPFKNNFFNYLIACKA
jgi:hypothetical protein